MILDFRTPQINLPTIFIKFGNPEKSGIAELPDQELEIIKYISEKKKYITEIIAGLLEVSDRGARGILAGLVEKQMRFILWKGKKDIPQKAALLGRKVKRASREVVPFLFAYRGVRRHERQTFYTKFLEFARFL